MKWVLVPVSALILVSGALWAQQPGPTPNAIDQALKGQIGELMFNNTILITEMKRLSDENKALKAENETLKAKEKGDAKHDTKDGANDGSGRP